MAAIRITDLRKNIYTPTEKRNLLALKAVLRQFSIPESYYSLSGFADASVCLSKSGEQWELYVGERGRKTDLEIFDTANEACKELIRQVSDKTNRDEMLFDYIRRMLNYSVAARPSAPTWSYAPAYARSRAIRFKRSGVAKTRMAIGKK